MFKDCLHEFEDRTLTTPIAFTKDNKQVYWLSGQDSDLGELIVHDFDRPDRNQVLYKASRTQIFGVILHPLDRTVLSVTEYYHKPEIYVANGSFESSTFEHITLIQETIMEDMQYLVNLRPHATLLIESTSNDFNLWLVTYNADDHPFEFFLYNRSTRHTDYLFRY